jgi:serine/threonine-protein kinase
MFTPLAPGTVVGGRYRLERELGRGGVGVVWAAQDQGTGTAVAVKVLLSETPDALARFRREARALLSLEHPGIVRVTDVVGGGEKIDAIVMERLEGETLRQRLLRGAPLAVGEACGILRDVAVAVAYAHERGVLHRDLKPENVLLCRPGPRTVVLDFGLTRWIQPEGAVPQAATLVTALGSRLGTVPYMAPEQLEDEGILDSAVDVWALGVVLYECLAGFRPFEGRSDPELMRRILLGVIAPLSLIVPGIPVAVSALAERLLDRDRTARSGALADASRLLGEHATSGT